MTFSRKSALLEKQHRNGGPPLLPESELWLTAAGWGIFRLAGLLAKLPSGYEVVAKNLLENANQYTPPGGPAALSVKDAGKRIVPSVSDIGIGISGGHTPEQNQLNNDHVRNLNPLVTAH
jgi:hypothetical protein